MTFFSTKKQEEAKSIIPQWNYCKQPLGSQRKVPNPVLTIREENSKKHGRVCTVPQL